MNIMNAWQFLKPFILLRFRNSGCHCPKDPANLDHTYFTLAPLWCLPISENKVDLNSLWNYPWNGHRPHTNHILPSPLGSLDPLCFVGNGDRNPRLSILYRRLHSRRVLIPNTCISSPPSGRRGLPTDALAPGSPSFLFWRTTCRLQTQKWRFVKFWCVAATELAENQAQWSRSHMGLLLLCVNRTSINRLADRCQLFLTHLVHVLRWQKFVDWPNLATTKRTLCCWYKTQSLSN